MIQIKIDNTGEGKIASQIPVCEYCGDEFVTVRGRDDHERFSLDNPWLEANLEQEQQIEAGETEETPWPQEAEKPADP